jgi:hypothetical protein
MPTHLENLVIESKRLQRLQSKRSKLRKGLRDVEVELRLVRKHVRTLKILAAPGGAGYADLDGELTPGGQLPPTFKPRKGRA